MMTSYYQIRYFFLSLQMSHFSVVVAHGVLFACVTVVKATQKNSRIAALPT